MKKKTYIYFYFLFSNFIENFFDNLNKTTPINSNQKLVNKLKIKLHKFEKKNK